MPVNSATENGIRHRPAFVCASSMPPTPDDYVRENIEPTLTKGRAARPRTRARGSPNGSKQRSRRIQSVWHRSPSRSRCRRRSPSRSRCRRRSAAATARYSTTADLRKLLTHDEERGGIPIRLLSARWLLTHFQAEGNETARLEHRQWLEREHPEAFVSGEALERVLAELEERTVKYKDLVERDTEKHGTFYMSKAASGEWRAVTMESIGGDEPVSIAFPSAMALSHMWLDKAHPRPERPQPARHVAAGDRVALLGAREAAYD